MKMPLRYIGWTAAGLLLCALLLMGGFFWYSSLGRLPDGLTVSGWAVGGMRYAAFDAELAARETALAESPVQLRTGAYGLPPLTTTYGQLGVQTSAAALREELARLRGGTAWERARERWRLRGAALELRVTLPEAGVTAVMRPAWRPLYEARPVDARRVITADDRVTYVAGQSVPRVDAPQLSAALLSAAPQIAALEAQPPGGGAGTGRPAAEQQTGPIVRPGALVMLDVPLVQEMPRVTVASLKAEGVERKFVQFSTVYSQSSEGRQHNIESAAAVVQDMYIKPGDIFDYAKVIAETQKRFGFQEAPVILNGKVVPGVGGGICQVSTTLYNAVLRAGLEVVERRNHSLPISYVPMGQDATFSTGYINFRFRNNTGSGLVIRTVAANGRLTVKLFGKTPEDITYEVQSRIVRTLDPSVKYVRNRTLRRGEQRQLIAGQRGYVVETVRYKKQSGKVIGQELISRDTYYAQPIVIGINSGTKAAEGIDDGAEVPKPHIEDGVEGPKFP